MSCLPALMIIMNFALLGASAFGAPNASQRKGIVVETGRKYLGSEKRYYVENGFVFYDLGHSPSEKIAADAATFRVFDLPSFGYQYASIIAADKTGFFVQKDFVPWPDAHLAEIIFPYNSGDAICMVRVGKKLFMIDPNGKKLHELKIAGDPMKFRALPTGVPTTESRYFVDSQYAYFLEPYKNVLTKLDVDDIAKFNPSPRADTEQVYRFTTSKGVYQGSKIIEGADPTTFKFGSVGYGFDRDHVYWLGGTTFRVKEADRATFEELESSEDGFDAIDKNHSYRGGKPAQPLRRGEEE